MKVVLFCGGLGTRLREHSETIPKPLVNVGNRPLIWHLMRYYAHFGHKEFILCLGYRGDMIRSYFLDYNECMSNDFTLFEGGKRIELAASDIDDWTITFVDTGLNTNIGTRLLKVRKYLQEDDMFLANYADGLSDLPLDAFVDSFRSSGAVGGFIAVRPRQSFHCIRMGEEGTVTAIQPMTDSNIWINGGYFCFRQQIFEYMRAGEELVEEPFNRLVSASRLWAHRYNGFWAAMDTFKDKMTFDQMDSQGQCPWMKWKVSS